MVDNKKLRDIAKNRKRDHGKFAPENKGAEGVKAPRYQELSTKRTSPAAGEKNVHQNNKSVVNAYERFQSLKHIKSPVTYSSVLEIKKALTKEQQGKFRDFVNRELREGNPYMKPAQGYSRLDDKQPPPPPPPPIQPSAHAVAKKQYNPNIHLDSDYDNATSGDRNKTTDYGRLTRGMRSNPNTKNARPQTPPGYNKF